MTEQEAIKILDMFLHKQCDLERTNFAYSQVEVWHAVEKARDALKKQLPKKPIDGTHDYNTYAKMYKNMRMIYCPSCNERLKLKTKGKHCDKCGQCLNWEEV